MPRVNRQTHNQVLFRAVNENIAEISDRFEVGKQSFFCECSQTGCTEMLDVPAEVYGQIRSDPSRYLVRSGHQDPTHEMIVEDFGDYLIVQAEPAAVDAARMSPIGVARG